MAYKSCYFQLMMFVLAVIVATQVAARPTTGAAISCRKVTSSLIPCISYLTRGGHPMRSCCNGVRGLRNIATTTPTRRAVCNCIKEAATHIKSIKQDAASQLFAKCGIKIGIPISQHINCDSIS
uniref:Non-specific lipid-transfer protein n=1 Tax=Kalanchoe fedtschenkoi TaxID=63787 RepID=A0A7N0T3H5_KALFE